MTSPPIGTDTDLERMFLAALPVIDRIIAVQVQRHALSAADAEDYASWVRARIIGDDYSVFRNFGERSSLKTYLTAVFINFFRDYWNEVWGRWRPSAPAKRLGPIAIRLEDLLYRKCYSLREATQVLRSAGVILSDAEISRLASSLPARSVPREVSLDRSDETGAAATPYAAPLPTGEDDPSHRIEATLRVLIRELPPEDGLILKMRFWNGVAVADIARALRLDQKALYRRIKQINARLRVALEADGIDKALAREVLSEATSWSSCEFSSGGAQDGDAWPSTVSESVPRPPHKTPHNSRERAP